ncbi:MAG: hypothetical protein RKU31_45480 [Deltaproteobacteria bacterium]
MGLLAGWMTGCGISTHTLKQVPGEVISREVTDVETREEAVGPRRVYAEGLRVDDDTLTFTLMEADTCIEHRTEHVDVVETELTAWVDDEDEVTSMSSFGGAEILAGLTLGLAIPLCGATSVCDDDDDEPTEVSDDLAGALLIAGGVVIATGFLIGMVDIIIGSVMEREDTRTYEVVERKASEPRPCLEKPAASVAATLLLGSAGCVVGGASVIGGAQEVCRGAVPFNTDPAGRARIPLGALDGADALQVEWRGAFGLLEPTESDRLAIARARTSTTAR